MAFICHVVDNFILENDNNITISCTKIFVGIYFHILTQYEPIIGRIKACFSIRIIIFWEVEKFFFFFFMSHDINNNDETCIRCLRYFELGTDREISFLLMSWVIAQSRNLSTTYAVGLHSVRPMSEMIWKNIIYIWFSHSTLKDTSVLGLSRLCVSVKTDFQWGLCWPTDWQLKLSLLNCWIAVVKSKMTFIYILLKTTKT